MSIVYCSGPLFSPEERAAMARIAEVLEHAGFETFVPHRDGIEAWVMGSASMGVTQIPGVASGTRVINKMIFALDVYQILDRCDALVMNLNGRVPDEGAVAETAMAYAAGRPLVIYKDDPRSNISGTDNAMLLGLSPDFGTIRDITAIPGAVARRQAQSGSSTFVYAPPPRVARTLRLGKKVWAVLERANRLATQDRDANAVLAELTRLDAEAPNGSRDSGWQSHAQ